MSSYLNVLIAHVSSAQQSQLQQQIKPFECIYTTTQTGGGSTLDSTCDNQPIPLLTSVTVNDGRPLLRGTFDASRSSILRIWINEQWYTLGTDARLTVANDAWQLDFSELVLPLQPGLYTVMAEVETTDGLLLRNTDAGLFIVTAASLVAPPVRQGVQPNVLQPGLLIPTILPQTQEGGQLPGAMQLPQLPVAMRDSVRDNGDAPSANVVRFVFAGVTLATVIGGAWVVQYFWRR